MEPDNGSSGANVLTLPELVSIAKQYRYEVTDDTLFHDNGKFQDFLQSLLNVESQIDEINLTAEDGISFTVEKRLALAEAQSLSTAISAFDLRTSELSLPSVPPNVGLKAFSHAAKALKNALGRFVVLADGVQ